MALGSLVDAGADPDEIRTMLQRLPLDGWELDFEPVLRGGIAGTKAHVRAAETSVLRMAGHILGMVEEARLPERVSRRATATFRALADAEGQLHNRPPHQVHFHEVGGIDAIIDVVGTCAALEVLGVDEIYGSPVANGIGMVRSAHGFIPIPAPATVELLKDAPSYGIDIDLELTTPTGAALLAANVSGWGAMPAMTIRASGFGAGTRELDDRPNLTQVVLGTTPATLVEPGQTVQLLQTNVDDVTGEALAHTINELLDAGAYDAWITNVLGKKGRPSHVVSALADPTLAGQVAETMVAETGSLGVRASTLQRWPQSRRFDEVEVEGRTVRIKVSAGRAKVEYEDAARLARQIGVPLREAVSKAEAAWHAQDSSPGLHSVED